MKGESNYSLIARLKTAEQMHFFPLNPKTHADFLKQERKDPITGDAFKAGDEVVFCAACRSAFLRESWEFMEGKHCNQEETLESFPKAQKALTLQRLGDKRWYPKYFANSILYEKERVKGILIAIFGMPTLPGFLALLVDDWEAAIGVSLYYFFGGVILFTIPYSISILVFLDKITTKKYFSISTKKLFFSFNQSFKAKDIQHLQFTLLKRVAKKDILQFTIQLKNKEGFTLREKFTART